MSALLVLSIASWRSFQAIILKVIALVEIKDSIITASSILVITKLHVIIKRTKYIELKALVLCMTVYMISFQLSPTIILITVCKELAKLSKLFLKSGFKSPANSCIPMSANVKIKNIWIIM